MKLITNSLNDGKWAVVLCGGRGSRMGGLTEKLPKPLLLVHGKPIIWYSFWALYRRGFRNFIFPTGYLGIMIKEYIEIITDNLQCNIYIKDTGIDAPIADRIKNIIHFIPDNEDFFLINSDTLFDFDISSMYDHHINRGALVTLSSVEVISPWGILTIQNNQIVGFDRGRKVQKMVSSQIPNGYGVVNSGLAWVAKKALDLIDFERVHDFETELFGAAIARKRIENFPLNGIWVPIDTPKDLNAFNFNPESSEDLGIAVKKLNDDLSKIVSQKC